MLLRTATNSAKGNQQGREGEAGAVGRQEACGEPDQRAAQQSGSDGGEGPLGEAEPCEEAMLEESPEPIATSRKWRR